MTASTGRTARTPVNSTPPVVVMGVAGSGKSALGAALAKALGAHFIEGDALHPAENVALMAAGTPLTDENRVGWLDAVGNSIAEKIATGEAAVAACSALKRRYRDQLRGIVPSLVFLHLSIDRETAAERMRVRTDHFMPTSLVESQFATLEQIEPDEKALTLDASNSLDELVRQAVAFLHPKG